MSKFYFAILFVALLISCKKESELITTHNVELINNSGHRLSFKEYNGADTIRLDSLDTYQFSYEIKGNSDRNRGLFEEFGDSLRVTYNDTLSIFHGAKRYSVARDVRNTVFYTHSITLGTRVHSYTYTFTNVDFNEAIMVGDTL